MYLAKSAMFCRKALQIIPLMKRTVRRDPKCLRAFSDSTIYNILYCKSGVPILLLLRRPKKLSNAYKTSVKRIHNDQSGDLSSFRRNPLLSKEKRVFRRSKVGIPVCKNYPWWFVSIDSIFGRIKRQIKGFR